MAAEEEAEIVKRVTALCAAADAVERRLALVVVRAETLAQAVMAKALRGELAATAAEVALAT